MIKPTLQKPITIDSLQKYSIELEGLVHFLEYEKSELLDELNELKEKNTILENMIKKASSITLDMSPEDAYKFSSMITLSANLSSEGPKTSQTEFEIKTLDE
jgi:hypothetical protein